MDEEKQRKESRARKDVQMEEEEKESRRKELLFALLTHAQDLRTGTDREPLAPSLLTH